MRALDKKRLLAELAAINERYPEMELRSREPPTLVGRVDIDGETRDLRLILPRAYPGIPPQIHELDPQTGEVVPDSGRARRLGEHGLCLFPHGNDPQAWRPDRRAVEALDRFKEFIRLEREQTSLYAAGVSLHVPRRMHENMSELGPGHIIARRAEAGGDLFAAMVYFDRSPELGYPTMDPRWAAFLPNECMIPWIVVTTDKPWIELVGSREILDQTLRDQLPEAVYQQHRAAPQLILVRKSQAGALDVKCIHRPSDNLRILRNVPVVFDTPTDCLFNRVDGALSNRDALADETVVIIGLGSLGGAVALALARAGVQRFILIDPDTLSIENVCRHVGTLRDLGRHKVEIIGEAITCVNPDAEVLMIPKSLAWDLPSLSAGADLDALLTSQPQCTIVCTCAEPTPERQLNALAVENGVSAIYAAALGSAEHGRIFRVIPGQTPCYACILAAQDADGAKFPRFISNGLGAETPPAYLDPSLPGLGIDVTQIAMIAARFTLQTIAENRGIDLGLPSERGHHLIWSNRGGWLFDRPLQLIVERYPRAPGCPVCGTPVEAEALDDAEQEALASLVAKMQPGVV